MVDVNVETELAGYRQRMAIAAQQGVEKNAMQNFGGFTDTMPGEHDPVSPWVSALPKNIGAGLIDAVVNTADQLGRVATAIADKTGIPKTPPGNKVDETYYAARDALLKFRDGLKEGSSTSDEMTQAIAQYAIPALGYTKLIGGLRGASALGTAGRVGAVEAMTSSTVLDPHAQRFADVLALGKHVEGKFGRAVNALAPDGSLLNAYINYMTDRTNESDFEGTVKNVIDNLGFATVTTGLFTAGAKALKLGMKLPGYIAETAGPGPVGLSAQRGSIGVANNASGESSASLEAINRAAQEQAAGLTRMRINEDGTVQLLLGVDAVDAKARGGQIIVQRGVGNKEWTVLGRGPDVKDAHIKGRLNSAHSDLEAALKGEKP